MQSLLLWILILCAFLLGSAFVLPSECGVVQKNHLFYLGRSKDANQIFYDLNWMSNGQLDSTQPIKPYWIKFAEDGRKEDLTNIQAKFAYGLEFSTLAKDQFVFNFVSYPSRKMILIKDSDGIYRVHMPLAGQNDIVLEAIYVKIEGGSFWVPNVTGVSVYGRDLLTQLQYEEHFTP